LRAVDAQTFSAGLSDTHAFVTLAAWAEFVTATVLALGAMPVAVITAVCGRSQQLPSVEAEARFGLSLLCHVTLLLGMKESAGSPLVCRFSRPHPYWGTTVPR
jgi:hypothetical protein